MTDLAAAVAPTPIGCDGGVDKQAVAALIYSTETLNVNAAEYAARKLTTRFRMRLDTARLVCCLSGLGGAA